MGKFMLLLHEDPRSFAGLSPEEIQRVIEKYTAWRNELADAGKLVASDKLTDEGGRHLSAADGGRVRVVDGPFAEAKEVLGGYFIVDAADYDEAVEISKTCPHLGFGWIELRAVDAIHD